MPTFGLKHRPPSAIANLPTHDMMLYRKKRKPVPCNDLGFKVRQVNFPKLPVYLSWAADARVQYVVPGDPVLVEEAPAQRNESVHYGLYVIIDNTHDDDRA